MQEKVETVKDAMIAITTLAQLSHSEDGDMVELNVGEIRNCLELMLSMLEAYEGVDVASMEGMIHLIALRSTHEDMLNSMH